MDDTIDTRKASLGRGWQALTDEHERQLERAEESFTRFSRDETVDPLALVGAYRSGKTQLIYHLFNHSWKNDIPAFYIGDPGEMLSEFNDSDETNLNTWIQEKIDRQFTAYVENDPQSIDWFPNEDSKTKLEFVESHGNDISPDETVKTALFFDEVEQSYREFIRAMDKDDDNPLRKINDGLQDSIKVWSFGMISAFEFIGEADWGRMREIRIPPLEVEDVGRILEERRPDATELANVIWWLARGRTGLIIKYIDGLPEDIDKDATDWIRSLAEADFRDTRLINNLWTELDREEWESAIKALLFLEDGRDEWQVEGEDALTVNTCQEISMNILKDEFSFEQNEDHQNAQEILDRNVRRSFSGLTVTEDELFPEFGLAEQEEADAFLSIVSDMTVSFEPSSDPRSIALEALDSAEGKFHTNWMTDAKDAKSREEAVTTPSPSIIQDAFPPIAVNPKRVSGRSAEDIEEMITRGLTIETESPVSNYVSIHFCPTEQSYKSELKELKNSYDITSPTVLVVPEDEDFEVTTDEAIEVYSRHHLLRIESYQSNRFWTFIKNLYGRLKEEALLGTEATMDANDKSELLSRCEDREVRNTIETLYDQLEQVAVDRVESLEKEYRGTYSLENSSELLWEEERLNGTKPYWSNGEFVESTIALSYLILLGPEYEPQRDYSKLYQKLDEAIDKGLVSGRKGGFQFDSYFDELFTQDGYSDNVATERRHYEERNQLAPAVRETRDALTALARLNDTSNIVAKLDDPKEDVGDMQVPVASVDGLTKLGYSLIRALLISGLAIGEDSEIDTESRLRNLKSYIESEVDTVGDYKENVEAFDEKLTPPEVADVGEWIDIKSSRLDQYETNLSDVQDGIEDLIEKVQADSSAEPIAYHYSFLIDIYLDDISGKIDDLESRINKASINTITNAVNIFEGVYNTIEEKEFVDIVFEDSRQSLLSQLEDYGDEVFSLESKLGHTEVSIPEDNEDLESLNNDVREHVGYLSSLKSNLDTLEEESDDLEEELEESRELVNDLLSKKEMEVADD